MKAEILALASPLHKMANAAEPRLRMNTPLTSRKHYFHGNNDDTFSDTDTDNLMGEANAVLSVTPNATADLSAYLVPDERQSSSPVLVKTTPASLDTQDIDGLEEDSGEISELLDYLNDLGFDSPRSLLEAHSHRKQTPHTRLDVSTTAAATPRTLNRTAVQTPVQRSVLRERNNQTWPAGAKNILRSSSTSKSTLPKQSTPSEGTTNNDKRHITFSSSPPVSQRLQSYAKTKTSIPEQEYNDENTNNIRSELDLDASLEELLEETASAMLSPRKTWQFSEEEWQRLEKVQQMAGILLREAEHERESARRWARSVHESVELWVEEQRALVETHSDSLTSDKAQLKVARDALYRLKMEMEASENHHGVVKEKLMAIIQRQADTIKDLETKLQARDKADTKASTFMSPPRVSVKNTLTPAASIRPSRISLSPTIGQQRAKHVESTTAAPSPISVIDPITPTKHDALPDSVPTPMSMTVTPRTQRARAALVDGGKLVVYRNGTEKETRPDGTCIIRFPNGDVKCTLGGDNTIGIVAYYHATEKVCSLNYYSMLCTLTFLIRVSHDRQLTFAIRMALRFSNIPTAKWNETFPMDQKMSDFRTDPSAS